MKKNAKEISSASDPLPFLRPEDSSWTQENGDGYVVLFDGNSITRHAVSPVTIEKYGWDRLCGMAASCEGKDYAHLLAAKIQGVMPGRKVRLLFGSPQRTAAVPDLVVFQGGEHVTGETLPTYGRFLTDYFLDLRSRFPKAAVIALGLWNPRCREEFKTCTGANYAENAVLVERIQREVAANLNIPFASVSQYENDPANTGDGKVAAVRWHPNDNGMRCYAEEAFKAFLKTQGRAVVS